jgi:hypothetical protein
MLEPGNLVHSSAPGCHIAGAGGDPSSAWVLSRRRFSRRSLGLRKADAVPDISLEPQSKTLMFLNPSDGAKAFFVSVLHRCTARHGPLAAGASRDAQGQTTPVTTLVVTVQPQQIVEVCTVQVRRAREVQIFSDIVELRAPLPPAGSAEYGPPPSYPGCSQPWLLRALVPTLAPALGASPSLYP